MMRSSSATASSTVSATVIAAQDFDFMGGSLGMAAGEAVIKGLDTAVEKGCPFVLFAASGGARMQEGILSLMQMPRTTIAVERLHETRRPYIVVLTNPTTGGVTASYAMLGDVHIAEPGALIGFAGPRVIEQTIREKLPEGFQRAEYLRDHGMVDMVVHRHDLQGDHRAALPAADEGAHCRGPGRRPPATASACRRRRERAGGGGGSGPAASDEPGSNAGSPSSRDCWRCIPKRIDLSLGRIERLLAALGHPERRLPPVIHVAGTNGKGSTIAFMRAILEAAGQARARLYLAQSGPPQRALPHWRAPAAASWSSDDELAGVLVRMRSRERRRADHRVRDRDGGGVSAVRAASGRCSPARSRARRASRRHQCRGASRWPA